MTLAELALFLVARGFIVHPRTWSMGETLLVTHERLRGEAHGVVTFSDIVYVRKEPHGAWTYTNEFGGDAEVPGVPELLEVLTRRLQGR